MTPRDLSGKRVLITGASSGIGLAIAREAARRGASLVLVARRADLLEKLASELRATGADVSTSALDITDTKDVSTLLARCDGSALPDVVIQNAGRGKNGRFLDMEDAVLDGIGELNVIALTRLAHAFGGKMAARKSGAFLFVASVAGFVPSPFHAYYAASKTFVVSFSEALRMELAPHGIAVSCLCPGITDTEFFDAGGYVQKSRLYRGKRMSAARVAEAALDGLRDRRAIIVPGFANGLWSAIAQTAPLAWIAHLTAGFMSTDDAD